MKYMGKYSLFTFAFVAWCVQMQQIKNCNFCRHKLSRDIIHVLKAYFIKFLQQPRALILIYDMKIDFHILMHRRKIGLSVPTRPVYFIRNYLRTYKSNFVTLSHTPPKVRYSNFLPMCVIS